MSSSIQDREGKESTDIYRSTTVLPKKKKIKWRRVRNGEHMSEFGKYPIIKSSNLAKAILFLHCETISSSYGKITHVGL
jgi:hypothetical protein